MKKSWSVVSATETNATAECESSTNDNDLLDVRRMCGIKIKLNSLVYLVVSFPSDFHFRLAHFICGDTMLWQNKKTRAHWKLMKKRKWENEQASKLANE